MTNFARFMGYNSCIRIKSLRNEEKEGGVNIEVVVYLDILFIVNLLYSFIGILLTTLVVNIPAKLWRLIVIAVVDAIFQLIIIVNFHNEDNIVLFLLGFVIEVFNILLVFGKLRIKKFLSYMGVHMGIIFLMGGIVTAVHERYVAYKQHEMTIMGVILIGILTFLVIKYTLPIILRSIYYRERIYEVILSLKGKEIKVKGLLDTGNSLLEPTTGKKVTIVEKRILSKFNDLHIEKIFIIPYKSLGKEDGVLYGIEVDSMTIRYEKYRKVHDKAIIAIYSGDLSKDGRYNAILHSESMV